MEGCSFPSNPALLPQPRRPMAPGFFPAHAEHEPPKSSQIGWMVDEHLTPPSSAVLAAVAWVGAMQVCFRIGASCGSALTRLSLPEDGFVKQNITSLEKKMKVKETNAKFVCISHAGKRRMVRRSQTIEFN